jgi:hypothetical protein
MTPTETLAIARALSSEDHAYIGIRPADATPGTTAPAFLLTDHTESSFSYQLACARLYWPACRRWALIGSDQINQEHSDHMLNEFQAGPPAPPGVPPTLRTLTSPDVLTTFET